MGENSELTPAPHLQVDAMPSTTKSINQKVIQILAEQTPQLNIEKNLHLKG